MFSGFFNYDNPVWRFIGKFWDILMVNILWMICSIPIFTIGASTTAMYYVTLKLVRDEDGYTFRSFFKSFKENFKQATIIWLIFLAAGIVLGVDIMFFRSGMGAGLSETVRLVMTAVFGALCIVWFIVMLYVFPVLSRFYNSVRRTILSAFVMAVRHLFTTISMVVADAVIVFLTLTYMPFLFLFGMGLIAFVNSYFLHRVFKKYIPEEERDIHEMRPIFADVDEKAAMQQEVQAEQNPEV